jgi:hypothetical protein
MVVERSPAVSQTAQPEKSTQDRKGKAPATDDDGEGWENFREDPILTGAARQAHFDPAVLDKNHVRRRTGKVYRQSLNASAEWTTPGDLGEDDEATYDEFVQLYPDGTINKALWSLNSEDLSCDLVGRLEVAARYCTGPDGPRFC